ncbi:hypothetical protein RQP46_002066 [Phenoliferia psychrophenolica]
MEAQLLRQVLPPFHDVCPSEGSVQTFEDGRIMVGWGIRPYYTEFDANDHVLHDVQFGTDFSTVHSYRAFKSPWTGYPRTRPSLHFHQIAMALWLVWTHVLPSILPLIRGEYKYAIPSGLVGTADVSGDQCRRCGKTAYAAEAVNAVGQRWHRNCLRCAECSTSLNSHLSERDGLPYCRKCYDAHWGPMAKDVFVNAHPHCAEHIVATDPNWRAQRLTPNIFLLPSAMLRLGGAAFSMVYTVIYGIALMAVDSVVFFNNLVWPGLARGSALIGPFMPFFEGRGWIDLEDIGGQGIVQHDGSMLREDINGPYAAATFIATQRTPSQRLIDTYFGLSPKSAPYTWKDHARILAHRRTVSREECGTFTLSFEQHLFGSGNSSLTQIVIGGDLEHLRPWLGSDGYEHFVNGWEPQSLNLLMFAIEAKAGSLPRRRMVGKENDVQASGGFNGNLGRIGG